MTPSIQSIARLAAGPALALLLSACASQAIHLDEVGAPQVPVTTSVDEADAKLKLAASEREAAESTYAAREQECYTRFFVNNCLDKAREQRRVVLVRLRAVEAEANHYKRAESVRLRDLELARTQQEAQADLEQRTAATPTPLKVVTPQPATAPAGKSAAQRKAEHEARLQKDAAQQAAQAPQRAASEAAYAARQAEAAKRQARVAKRLADREADAAAKAAKAAAAASAPPAPLPGD